MKNDAITIAPHIHKLVFENGAIRVLEVRVKPNDKAEMHWHPANMVYVINPGLLRFINEKGEAKDVELKKGQVTQSSSEVNHIVENIGTSELLALQVEFKK